MQAEGPALGRASGAAPAAVRVRGAKRRFSSQNPAPKLRGRDPRAAESSAPGLGSQLPNKVQNIPPSTGSGREAKSAVNLPMVPSRSMIPAPYWITLLLPTCTETPTADDGARAPRPSRDPSPVPW